MMTRIMADLFLIGISLVFIIDLSGISSTIDKVIWRLGHKFKPMPDDYQAKPFTCSLCMTFWTSLTYLIAKGELSIMTFALVCANSYLTTTYVQLLLMSKAIIDKFIGTVQRWAER